MMNDDDFKTKVENANGMENTKVLEISGNHALSVETIAIDTKEYFIHKRTESGLIEHVVSSFNATYINERFAELSGVC